MGRSPLPSGQLSLGDDCRRPPDSLIVPLRVQLHQGRNWRGHLPVERSGWAFGSESRCRTLGAITYGAVAGRRRPLGQVGGVRGLAAPGRSIRAIAARIPLNLDKFDGLLVTVEPATVKPSFRVTLSDAQAAA